MYFLMPVFIYSEIDFSPLIKSNSVYKELRGARHLAKVSLSFHVCRVNNPCFSLIYPNPFITQHVRYFSASQTGINIFQNAK